MELCKLYYKLIIRDDRLPGDILAMQLGNVAGNTDTLQHCSPSSAGECIRASVCVKCKLHLLRAL